MCELRVIYPWACLALRVCARRAREDGQAGPQPCALPVPEEGAAEPRPYARRVP